MPIKRKTPQNVKPKPPPSPPPYPSGGIGRRLGNPNPEPRPPKPANPLNLTAADRKALHNTLLDAFRSDADLELMVNLELGESMNTIVEKASLRTKVLRLIQWAEARGKIPELIDAAHTANPSNYALSSLKYRYDPKNFETRPLTTTERQELQRVLLSVFGNVEYLGQFVQKTFNRSLNSIVSEASLEAMIEAVITYAETHNKLPQLINAAYDLRPGNQPQQIRLDKVGRKQLQAALLKSFPTIRELKELVRFGLDVSLTEIVETETLRSTIFELIEWVESRGMLRTLIEEAVRDNPKSAIAGLAREKGWIAQAR